MTYGAIGTKPKARPDKSMSKEHVPPPEVLQVRTVCSFLNIKKQLLQDPCCTECMPLARASAHDVLGPCRGAYNVHIMHSCLLGLFLLPDSPEQSQGNLDIVYQVVLCIACL
jgi:hypothetical protein